LPSGASGISTTNSITVDYSTSAISGDITVRGNNTCGIGATASLTITVNPLPTVTNATTTSTCSGTSPNITLAASVPSNFAWTIGTITGSITGATAGSGATINQILTNPSNATAGTVQYLVTPTSTTGSCVGSSYTITVTVNPIPVVTNAATANTCSGTSSNISLTASAPSTFTWTIGNITGGITGASAGSGATINQVLTNPNTTAGTVQYLITPTSTAGSCAGNPYTITVTVNPLPSAAATITGTATVCQGQTNVLYIVPVVTNATSYVWSYSGTGIIFVGGSTTTTDSVKITFSNTATSGNLTVKGHNSCGDGVVSANYAITVNLLPVAAGTITGTTTLCQGQSGITYNLPSITNATSYIWTLPTGASGTSTTNSITVNYSATAVSGNIVVKGNNACGIGDSSILAITVEHPVSAAGIINGLTTVCQGQTAVVYNVPTITNATSYIWTLPTGASGTSTTNSITANYSNTAVSGNIVVKGSNSCGVGDSSLLAITVNPLPAAAGTITSVYNDSVSINENNVLYTVPVIVNATTYIWAYSGTGVTFIPSATTITDSVRINFANNATSGNLTVKGHNACGDGVVSAIYPIYVSPVGIGELANSLNYRIYPNPTKGIITIEIDALSDSLDLQIVNIQGKVLHNEKLINNKQSCTQDINLSVYPKGIYFVRFTDRNFTKVEKVVLQ